uniref:CCHC-type domain-containing protein n=1 Tax=Meloidogyne hapla TaxID=6305 RepID=A0A1I8B0N8_MELHA
MRAEEIQKLLELQQQQFQKNQSELQERQNQQLLLQQQQIAELIEKLGSKDAKQIEQDKSADYCKLNKMIGEFHCDIPRAYTFETWFEKYKTYFEIEGSTLSQELKVRLLISKLGGPEYSKIAQKLLPRKLNDLKFEELIKELKEEFGDPRSKLLKRFDTLKLKCNDFENVLEFGNLVNAECEKSLNCILLEEKSPTKNWNNYRPNYRPPPKIPYCNHCKKDGHWTLNCYFAGRRKFSPRVNTIKIQPLIENQPSKKKIVWEKQKPLKKPIVQVKYCKGKKVLVKNKNNRSGVIEWLKGEIVGKIGKLFRIEVYCLKNIILRKIEDIKEDNSQAKNNSKKYNVQRSEEMPCIDESTPNKRAKILAEGSDDQIISTSEGTSHKDEKKRRYVKINNVIKKFFPSFL